MKFYIPTYEECLEIVNESPDMYFYERKYSIDYYQLSVFGYRHAKYNNFILPVIDKPHINALEMKGITYVFDDDGSYRHYLLLHKFWEMDQYDHSKYDQYKDKLIKNVTIKEDGFLISFLPLPSGEIISFAKHGFYEDTNIEANKYLENLNYNRFIKNCLDSGVQPIFEYVRKNAMIVEYDKNDLVLLKLRDNFTGKYLDIKDFDTTGISIVTEVHKSFSEILDMIENTENLEGWVVHFEDDDMLKVKTKWWRKHKK